MSYKELCDAETGIAYAGNCLPFLRCAIQVQEKTDLLHITRLHSYLLIKTSAPQ